MSPSWVSLASVYLFDVCAPISSRFSLRDEIKDLKPIRRKALNNEERRTKDGPEEL